MRYSYGPGEWLTLAHEGAGALVHPDIPPAQVERIWAAMVAGAPMPAWVHELVGTAAPYALVHMGVDGVRVLLRGAVSALVGGERLSGRDGAPWAEHIGLGVYEAHVWAEGATIERTYPLAGGVVFGQTLSLQDPQGAHGTVRVAGATIAQILGVQPELTPAPAPPLVGSGPAVRSEPDPGADVHSVASEEADALDEIDDIEELERTILGRPFSGGPQAPASDLGTQPPAPQPPAPQPPAPQPPAPAPPSQPQPAAPIDQPVPPAQPSQPSESDDPAPEPRPEPSEPPEPAEPGAPGEPREPAEPGEPGEPTRRPGEETGEHLPPGIIDSVPRTRPRPDQPADDSTIIPAFGPDGDVAPQQSVGSTGAPPVEGLPEATILSSVPPAEAAAQLSAGGAGPAGAGLRALLRVSTGQVCRLTAPVLIGRSPDASGLTTEGPEPQLLTVPSPNLDISRTHVEVRLEGDHVLVTDLRSTNGTVVQPPHANPRRLRAGESVPVPTGSTIDIGDGVMMTVEHDG